jgi:hypothetical protein
LTLKLSLDDRSAAPDKAGLLALALSPLDPIASRCDEVVLVAFALGVLWWRTAGARRSGY